MIWVAYYVFLNDYNITSPSPLLFSKVTLAVLPPRAIICVPHLLESGWGFVPTLTPRVQWK